MRSKEEAHDYRYFPDPDLLPVVFAESWVEQIRSALPELPLEKAKRFQTQYGLPEYDSLVLTQEREVAEYFEEVAKLCGNPKSASNWIMTDLMRELKETEKSIVEQPIRSVQLAEMIQLIDKGTISGKIAKTVFAEMWAGGGSPADVVAKKGLVQISDTGAIEKIIADIIAANPTQVAEYRGGKDKLFGFFVGQAMKASKGQANPDLLNQILKEKLKG
jgi:aspartyl-tRNA(Asn)/glutamyl-tRNA(Gln) amidotransferase subunit B